MKIVLNIILIAVPLHAVILPSGNCPQPDVISPCTCVNSTYHNLRCADMSDIEILQNVLRSAANSGIKSFKLTESTLPNFPLHILDIIPLDRLYIRHNHFQDLFNTSDHVQNAITHLVIKNVVIENDWQWAQLRSFRYLVTLAIHSTAIGNTVTCEFTREMSKNIESLSFIDCGIEVIESGVFRRQKKLKYISLQRNKLRILSRSWFPVPSALTQLNLENNDISHLPNDIFSDMPNLTFVTLSNNALSVMSEIIFQSLWESESALELQGNPMKCDCQMKWIAATNSSGSSVFGSCTHPKHLYGKALRELTTTDFNC